jgi:FkbM family methyltransferase
MNKLKRLALDFSRYLSYLNRRHDSSRQFVPVSWPRQARQRVWDKQSRTHLNFEIRRKTTDWPIFEQIFLQEDYRLSGLRRSTDIHRYYHDIIKTGCVPLILDCGANNGLSCAWFAQTYPEAFVVGIEPEAANFTMAVRNTQRLANVKLFNAAVAANDGLLSICDPGHGTSGYMTTCVADNATHNTIPAYSIASIIDHATKERPAYRLAPFIVNIDIEGFENDLFACNTDWIDSVPLIFVELHDWLLPGQLTSANFLTAVASRRRDFVIRGENVISIACNND